MNAANKTSHHVNPIDRDLAVVITIGFLAAMAIVTMGIVVMSQFL